MRQDLKEHDTIYNDRHTELLLHKYLATSNELVHTKKELEETKLTISKTNKELSKTKEELKRMKRPMTTNKLHTENENLVKSPNESKDKKHEVKRMKYA